MFVLKWISNITGYSSKGTHAFPNEELIDKYITKLNKKQRDIFYIKEKCPENTPLLNIIT